jgi:Tfp pilus assembly protein PilO
MPTLTTKTFNWRLFVYTRKNLLVGIGAILAGLLIVAFAIWPQISSLIETQTKLKKEQAELKKVTIKLQELDQIKVSPEFSQVDTVNQVLPSRKPLLELMTGLNSISGATGVAISDLKIAPGQIATDSSELTASSKKNPKDYAFLDLSVVISGELNNIQRFLSLIEQISPITTITKINLSREHKMAASGAVLTKAELDLRVYYFTQQITFSLTAPLPKTSAKELEIFKTIQSFTIPEADTTDKVEGGGNLNPFPASDIVIE